MNEEQLSALLDGELDELATARLFRALEQDPQALDDWEAYSLIGEALREGEGLGNAGRVGAQRAIAQLRDEPAPAPMRVTALVRARPFAPWALAASAAAVAFFFGGGPATQMVADRSGSAWNFVQVSLLGHGEGAQPVVVSASPDEMDRYVELHRAVAAPGFERTSLTTGAFGGSEQGQ